MVPMMEYMVLNLIAVPWKSLHQQQRLTSPMSSIMNFALKLERVKEANANLI